MSAETRGGARTFVRSLNILLKFARLYEFGHARTAAQFETTWQELRGALDESGGGGLLLGASGNQILLDGVPLGTAAGERSFAQLLITSGIASIHFSPALTQPQFARFVRAFPSGNAKPQSLADQLKSALAGETSIRVNEIRYVAEDSSTAGIKIATQLVAKTLGAQGDKFRDFLEDPNKMLQMILAAESLRSGGGGGRRAGCDQAARGNGPRLALVANRDCLVAPFQNLDDCPRLDGDQAAIRPHDRAIGKREILGQAGADREGQGRNAEHGRNHGFLT